MRRHITIVAVLFVLAIAAVVAYLGWPDTARLPIVAVEGARPRITPPRDQTIPTIGVASVVGWTGGATPTAAAGLKVAAFATGLDHPRWLYRLPNGDVLVAESNSPPRDEGGIKGWVMTKLMGLAGAGAPSADRITLLRDANGDGVAETRTTFLTGLHSPYGMTLMGKWLYVGDTDAVVRVPYLGGETHIAAKPELVVKLAGGGNHWARNLLAAPTARRCSSRSARRPTLPRTGWTRSGIAPTSCRSIPTRTRSASMPRACAIPTAWRSSRIRAICGRW